MDKSKIHPTAEIIQNGVINNPKFTFNHMSILDYPWASDCNLFFPTPYKNTEKKSYFFWRDYYDRSINFDYDDIPDDYMISFWDLHVLDGTTNYNYPLEEVPFPSVTAPYDQTSTDMARMNLEYTKTKCIWALRGCDCNQTGIPCLKDQNEHPELYWTDYSDEEYSQYSDGEDNQIVIRSLGTDVRNTLEYRLNLLENN